MMMFVEGILEHLRGLVKAYKPNYLQNVVNGAHDMQDVVPKIRFPPKPTFTPRTKDIIPPQRDWADKPKLDEETRREFRKNKFCLNCQEPCAPGNRCVGKDRRPIPLRYTLIVTVMKMRRWSRHRTRDIQHQERSLHRLGLRTHSWPRC